MIDTRSQKKRIGLAAESGPTGKAIDALEQVYSYSYKKEPSLAEINDKLDTILEHFRIQYPRPETEG